MRKATTTRRWPQKRLCEIAEIVKGKQPSRFATTSSLETLPYLEAAWLRRQSEPKYVSLNEANSLTLLDATDTLILWDGANAGEIFSGETGVVASTMARVRAQTTDILPEFLYLCILSFSSKLRKTAAGSTVPHVRGAVVNDLQIPQPSIPIQERIIQILQKTDEIRRKRQEALELADVILPSIFNGMFGTPESNPQGYHKKTLGKVTDLVTSGYTPRGGARNYVADGPLLIRSQNVKMLNLDLSDCAHLPETIHEEMSRVRVLPGDVLLNITGASIGRIAWSAEDIPPANVNQHVCIIRTQKDVLAPEYLAYTLATPWYQHIILNAPGSAQTGFNHARVRALKILVPPMPVQKSFVAQVEALRQAADKCMAGMNDIEATFQTLMSRAFSGELTAEWEAANVDWIKAQTVLHERLPRLLLLALIQERVTRARKSAQGAVLVTALMKYAFLFQMEGNGHRRFYPFVPYHYGPFAKEIYDDLDRLQSDGFVNVDKETDEEKIRITLADPAKVETALSGLPDDIREDVTGIIDAYGVLDHRALLKAVYEKYPAFTKRSRLQRGK